MGSNVILNPQRGELQNSLEGNSKLLDAHKKTAAMKIISNKKQSFES